MENVGIAGESEEAKQKRAERDALVRRLAVRLGVEPYNPVTDPMPIVSFCLEDGTRYSWDAFVYAHLAAMDANSGA